MSIADRDGKIAQKIADMHACLAMEINESVRDSSAEFEAVLDEIARDVPPAECRACRIQACEIEGNTAEPHTCVRPPADLAGGPVSRLLFCRECAEGKHRNCDGTAWDNEADAPAPCTCPDRDHQ